MFLIRLALSVVAAPLVHSVAAARGVAISWPISMAVAMVCVFVVTFVAREFIEGNDKT